MNVYLPNNVFDEALRRIRWLFDEFPHVVVAVSGGKDSTVVFELCMMVAKEKDRLPLTVLWIDQEIEWQSTVDTVRKIMERPDVNPMWMQMPMVISNATSVHDKWLHCWSDVEEEKWMRPREEYSIKENVYKTERFKNLFDNIIRHHYRGEKCCVIGGIRIEESPTRRVGVTGAPTYKGRTWGKYLTRSEEHYTMYPIYDWKYTDVWKAIHDNKWHYNPIYDVQYSYGIPVQGMRVSNLHHETAIENLWYLQEAEPETYDKAVRRISGIATSAHIAKDVFPDDLPYMFKDWKEYRDYLLEKLIDDPVWTKRFEKHFASMEELEERFGKKCFRVQITSIITNDYEGTKMVNFMNRIDVRLHRKALREERKRQEELKNAS